MIYDYRYFYPKDNFREAFLRVHVKFGGKLVQSSGVKGLLVHTRGKHNYYVQTVFLVIHPSKVC